MAANHLVKGRADALGVTYTEGTKALTLTGNLSEAQFHELERSANSAGYFLSIVAGAVVLQSRS